MVKHSERLIIVFMTGICNLGHKAESQFRSPFYREKANLCTKDRFLFERQASSLLLFRKVFLKEKTIHHSSVFLEHRATCSTILNNGNDAVYSYILVDVDDFVVNLIGDTDNLAVLIDDKDHNLVAVLDDIYDDLVALLGDDNNLIILVDDANYNASLVDDVDDRDVLVAILDDDSNILVALPGDDNNLTSLVDDVSKYAVHGGNDHTGDKNLAIISNIPDDFLVAKNIDVNVEIDIDKKS